MLWGPSEVGGEAQFALQEMTNLGAQMIEGSGVHPWVALLPPSTHLLLSLSVEHLVRKGSVLIYSLQQPGRESFSLPRFRLCS